MKKLILASTSPGRKEALEKAGIVFEVMPSSFEEKVDVGIDPKDLVVKLSRGKARDVASKTARAVVVGADTVGVFAGEIMGKPHTEEKDIEMLTKLSGKYHTMLTGLTLIDTESKKEISKVVETKVWFRDLSEEEIKEYVKSGEGLQKAGGYAYQGTGHKFVDRIEGSETNIIGMPIEDLKEMLKGLE